jgi:hypothetical protein
MAKDDARKTGDEEEVPGGEISEDAIEEVLDEDEDEDADDMPLLDEDGSEKWE